MHRIFSATSENSMQAHGKNAQSATELHRIRKDSMHGMGRMTEIDASLHRIRELRPFGFPASEVVQRVFGGAPSPAVKEGCQLLGKNVG